MTAAAITLRQRAGERARLWLESLSPLTREGKAMRSLGLLCCKRLRSGRGLGIRGEVALLRLPAMSVFVTMGRERTLILCRTISLASRRARRMGARKQETWSEMFGAVALSYARVGDPSTTAVLLRAAAQLGLKHPWLLEAERYLLDQQTAEGCFGLLARELALVESDDPPWMAYLNLSVEILWALAEVTELHATRRTDDAQHDENEQMPIRCSQSLAMRL